ERLTPAPVQPSPRTAHAASISKRQAALAEVTACKAAKARAEAAEAAARTAVNKAAAAVELARAIAAERARAETMGDSSNVAPISLAAARRDLEDREHEHEAAKAALAGVDSKLGAAINSLSFREDAFVRTRDAIIAAEVRGPLLAWYAAQCR